MSTIEPTSDNAAHSVPPQPVGNQAVVDVGDRDDFEAGRTRFSMKWKAGIAAVVAIVVCTWGAGLAWSSHADRIRSNENAIEALRTADAEQTKRLTDALEKDEKFQRDVIRDLATIKAEISAIKSSITHNPMAVRNSPIEREGETP